MDLSKVLASQNFAIFSQVFSNFLFPLAGTVLLR